MIKIPVEFRVIRGVAFHCLHCNERIEEMHQSQHHVASGSRCKNCGAHYSIDWHIPIEQSCVMVELVQVESEVVEP